MLVKLLNFRGVVLKNRFDPPSGSRYATQIATPKKIPNNKIGL